MFRNPRRYYERFSTSDPVTRIIAIIAFAILLIIALPRLVPGTASGIDCGALPIPRVSGSNQSVLASTIDPSVLHLELVPEVITTAQGAPLVMDVRYINVSMAPLTIFYDPTRVTFRYTQQEAGLLFSITTADGGTALGVPANVRPPFPVPQQFAANQLRVLGPTQRCTQRVEIDAGTLGAARVTQGEYRITAVYRNQFRGVIAPPGAQTPTPIFRDQGVWVGPADQNYQVQSNTIRLIVGSTQPPA
jgi:hypothetical protein